MSERALSARDFAGQIREMEKIWRGLKIKPEWLTFEDIRNYKKARKRMSLKDF